MTVITMSRQVGSRAEELAERLCDELHLGVFDKRLMMRVAAEAGLSESEIIDYSEENYKLRSFFETLFARGRPRPVRQVSTRLRGAEGVEQVDTMVLDESRAVDLVRATINAAYERGNVLIIGRGGQAILEDKPGVLHVRVVAPLEDRIARIQEQEGLTAPQARRLIEERDRATAEYLRTFHHIDVNDPTLYHLIVNTAKLGMDACVQLIKTAAESLS